MEKMQNQHIDTSTTEQPSEGRNSNQINSLTNSTMHNNPTCSKIHLYQTHNNLLSVSSTQT